MDYSGYQDLLVDIRDGVALLTMNRPEVFNATGFTLHNELGRIWPDLGRDPEVRVAVITGAGNAFSAGGDFDMIEKSIGNADVIAAAMQEARDIVHNMINLDKPVISAINGVAVGAGLAVALLADISIASERARFTDGHVRLGVAARGPRRRDLAVAHRHGQGQVLSDDLRVHGRGGSGALGTGELGGAPRRTDGAVDGRGPAACRWFPAGVEVHQALAQPWLRMAEHTAFDYSLALEMLGFFGPDVSEGLQSVREKRDPEFPSAR